MTITRQPEFKSDRAKNLWRHAREQAAVIGPFNPIDLVGKLQDTEVREALAALGNECVEILGEHRARWQLSADTRRRVLSMLFDQGRLVEAADRAPLQDAFTHYLRTALHGVLAVPHHPTFAQLEVARSAAQFAAPFGSSSRAWEWALDAAVAQQSAIATRNWVASRPLIGRDSQLRRLLAFAEGVGSGSPEGSNPWSLVVTGASGAGKSALLADFARRHTRAHGRAYPILWFDFDRATLAVPSPAILLGEFARQIGLAIPESRLAIDDFLKISQHFDDGADQALESFGQESSRATSLWSLWRNHVDGSWSTRPVLLILDTLEEVLVHRDGRAEQLASWLRAMVHESGLRHVRILLAGRNDGGQMQMLFSTGNALVELRDLHPRSAERLLKRNLEDADVDIQPVPTRALVEHYGGNPLTLKMMARYLRTWGPEVGHELLEDAGQERFASEMSHGILYKRILGRIRSSDPDLVKVAHPGLVLRRVTPQLIRQVLAEPCGLGAIDAARAKTLFTALSEQIWLVDTNMEPNAVRHRRDLRRLVFAMMNAARPECAEQIHRAAHDFYAAGSDLHLSPREQAIEAAYHLAFLEPDSFDDGSLKALSASLGEDCADLPASLRARLKLQSGRGLSNDEFRSLGQIDQEDVAVAVNRAAIRSAGVIDTAGLGSSSRGSPSLRAERAYGVADLETLLGLGADLVDEFFEELLLDRRGMYSALPEDFTSFSLWRAAMVARERREAAWMLQRLDARIADARVEWSAPLNRSTKQWFSRGEAINALRLMLGSGTDHLLTYQSRQTQSRPEISSTQELRLAQLIAQTGERSLVTMHRARVGVHLLRVLEKRWLERARNPAVADPLLELHPLTIDLLLRLGANARAVLPSLADITITNARQSFVDVLAESFSRPEISPYLRGLTPEIHQLVLVIARKQPASALLEFAGRAQQAAPVWPRELTVDSLSKSLRRDRDRWTGTLIEVADRSGFLPMLLDTLRQQAADSGQVRRVAAVLATYDQALVGTGEQS